MKWVLSRSGLRHIAKNRVYLCNQAVIHTKNYVKRNYKKPTCANCLMRINRYVGVNGLVEKHRQDCCRSSSKR